MTALPLLLAMEKQPGAALSGNAVIQINNIN